MACGRLLGGVEGAVDQLDDGGAVHAGWPASMRRWKSCWTCSPISSGVPVSRAALMARPMSLLASSVVKVGAKSLLEAAVGTTPATGIPRAQCPAVAGGDGGDVPEDLLVQAQPVRQHGTLGGGGKVNEEHQVVADLGGLAGGGTAGGDDVGGHRADVLGGVSDGAGFAAHHEGEGCRLGPAHAAGDGASTKRKPAAAAASCSSWAEAMSIVEESTSSVRRRRGQDAVRRRGRRPGRARPWAAS